jgi:hypothetical protein
VRAVAFLLRIEPMPDGNRALGAASPVPSTRKAQPLVRAN